MPYYAVESGNVLRCVLADDHGIAAITAMNVYLDDASSWDNLPAEQAVPGTVVTGELVAIHEFGTPQAAIVYLKAEDVAKAGNFYDVRPQPPESFTDG